MRKENEISSKCLTVLLLPVMQIPIGNKLNDVILELGYIYKVKIFVLYRENGSQFPSSFAFKKKRLGKREQE